MRLFGFVLFLSACAAQTPVIVISVDTLRADHVGSHTPNIASFASQGGTLFAVAETQIPLTLPSHTVLFTSTYPFANGVEENATKVPSNAVTLASVLRGRGYKTAAFIGSIFLEKQLGLDKGFDTYDSPFDFEAFSKLSGAMLFAGKGESPYVVRERRPGALVLRAANQWLEAHRGQPVFLFVHLFDMHQPYRTGSYTAELDSVDQLMGRFQQSLKKGGWWDRSLVVFLSDHGEGLGDHGESDHGYFVYESTLHVPLIFHWPQGEAKLPARVETPVGLIDVAPSVLDFLKIPAPVSFRGRSVLDGSPRPVFGESMYARDCFGWSPLRNLRVGPYKYVDSPKPELYDIGKDPGEMKNLVSADVGRAAAMRAQLAAFGSQPAPVSAGGDPGRKKEVLESLGYIAPGPRGTAKGPLADPKDKLPELMRYEDALMMMEEKRVDSAISVLRGIVASDPKNLLVRRDLGVALIERKEYQQARVELQQVLAAAPDDYVTRYEAGLADEALGLKREALAQFEAACRIAPGAAQCRVAIERVR